MLDPATLQKIVEIGGATAVLCIVVWAFATRIVVTKGELERQDKYCRDVIADKDRRIDRLEHDRDLQTRFTDTVQDSSHVQARVMNDLADALIARMKSSTSHEAAP